MIDKNNFISPSYEFTNNNIVSLKKYINDNNVILSILIPNYNNSNYIIKTLESILEQNLTHNYVIIINDDCSSDNSIELITNYKKEINTEKIFLFKNIRNSGTLLTTLKLYELTFTKYYTVLDSDDYWIDNNFLKEGINFLEDNTEFSIYGTNTKILENNNLTNYFDFTNTQVINENSNCLIITHTTSTIFKNFFRNNIPDYLYKYINTEYEQLFEGDTYRYVFNYLNGDKTMNDFSKFSGVYRITGIGRWTKLTNDRKDMLNYMFFNLMYKENKMLIKNPKIFHNHIKYAFGILNKDNNILNYDYVNVINEMSNRYKNIVGFKDIIIYMPSKICGGYEYFFANIANNLSKLKLNVKYVDYNDGFVIKNNLLDKSIQVINVDNFNNNSINIHSILLTPITLSYNICNSIKNIKYIFIYGHPYSIKWLKCIDNLDDNTLKTHLSNISNSIYFIDGTCKKSFYDFLETINSKDMINNLPKNYLPVFYENRYNTFCQYKIINENEINIGWLGRLDDDKIFALINILDCFVSYDTSFKKNIHVIGDGNSKHLINLSHYSDYNINVIFTGTLLGDEKINYMKNNIDIMFAMGMSIIESAFLKIPSIVVPVSTNKYFYKNCFEYIYNMTEFNGGYSLVDINFLNKSTIGFDNIMHDIYINNKKQYLGDMCYEYVLKSHTFDSFFNNFVNYLE